MPANDHITELIIKHLQDTITAEEANTLQEWVAANEQNRSRFDRLTNGEVLAKELPEFEESNQRIQQQVYTQLPEVQDALNAPAHRRMWVRWLSVAAAAMILISVASWYWWQGRSGKVAVAEVPKTQAPILPGGNKATLTLADGSVVDLTKANNGTIATEGKTIVKKKADGQLEYEGTHSPLATSHSQVYNILSTPRGGQYQVILPDQSKVWLNAESSIRYPTAFTGKERKVEITGEAYLDVTHNAAMPFHVLINGMDVQVLGTKFNVNGYNDEPDIEATLLEGRVKIVKGNAVQVLSPGQQANFNKEAQKLDKLDHVDVDKVMAWKNGYFQFKDADWPALMREITRWYDVDVEFKAGIPQRKFSGKIPRNSTLAQVIESLEALESFKANQVHFKLEGKKIIVLP